MFVARSKACNRLLLQFTHETVRAWAGVANMHMRDKTDSNFFIETPCYAAPRSRSHSYCQPPEPYSAASA